MIARMWKGWVRTEQANAYVAYITGTGLREYAATPGNLGCQMWTRPGRWSNRSPDGQLVGVTGCHRWVRGIRHRGRRVLPRG
jgi:hypothetical protein